ncbi:8192_t:CDS:1, partial [Racocetra persica]
EVIIDEKDYKFVELKDENEVKNFITKCHPRKPSRPARGHRPGYWRPRGGSHGPVIVHHDIHHYHTQIVNHTDYTKINKLNSKLTESEFKLTECEKHKQEIKGKIIECLKLLGINFSLENNLIELIDKLIKACEEMTLVGPVLERIWKCLKVLDPQVAGNFDPNNILTENGNLNSLVKSCYRVYNPKTPYPYINNLSFI